jgi:LysR family hydrogen peroxide-inducible transcriptional activator
MNFKQLEYALAVFREPNFGIAAEQCGVSQATLSAMIKKLEEEIGYLLFDRSHRPVKPTEAGLQFMEKARNILSEKEALIYLPHTSKRLRGSLRLGIIPTATSVLLPAVVKHFQDQHADLQLEILEMTTEEIKKQLMQDKLDLGILATPLRESQLQETILYYETMMVYGVSDHNRQFITSSEIMQGKVWLLEEGHCFREQAITICRLKDKMKRLSHFNYKGRSFENLLKITDMMGGYALIPELYFRELPVIRQKKCCPFMAPFPVREMSIVSYRTQANSQAIHFIEEIIAKEIRPRLLSHTLPKSDLEIIGF